MAAADDRSADGAQEGSGSSDTTRRRLRREDQRQFELDFFGRLLERDPSYAEALRVHAGNLAATGQYARALQADRRLARLWPDRPVCWYNLACSYALLGMLDPAFAALQRAVELGYRHIKHMCRDPDFKALRRDPRFGRLLRRLGGNAS
jgi:tetratricopeptide (TPR) repeat protein